MAQIFLATDPQNSSFQKCAFKWHDCQLQSKLIFFSLAQLFREKLNFYLIAKLLQL